MSKFKKATREQARLRMALDGPSGSGKSYTSLRFAFALGQKVAAIDTEHGSLAKYAGDKPDGIPWDFDVLELHSHNPSQYVEAIRDAAASGYEVLVIDSLSHAWMGVEGALEMVDKKGGQFGAWKDVTPLHRKMIEAIVSAPMHILATMRTKTEYVVEKDERGRSVPRKLGMAPVQREGTEYEFDLYCSLDLEHILRVHKTRCPAIDGHTVHRPGPEFLAPVIDWLKNGTPAAPRPTEPASVPPANGAAEEEAPDISDMEETDKITPEMAEYLKVRFKRKNISLSAMLKGKVEKLSDLTVYDYQDLLAYLETPLRHSPAS